MARFQWRCNDTKSNTSRVVVAEPASNRNASVWRHSSAAFRSVQTNHGNIQVTWITRAGSQKKTFVRTPSPFSCSLSSPSGILLGSTAIHCEYLYGSCIDSGHNFHKNFVSSTLSHSTSCRRVFPVRLLTTYVFVLYLRNFSVKLELQILLCSRKDKILWAFTYQLPSVAYPWHQPPLINLSSLNKNKISLNLTQGQSLIVGLVGSENKLPHKISIADSLVIHC